MRLALISVETELKGKAPAPAFVASIPRGTIGCNEFADEDHPSELVEGESYVFFLHDTPPRTGVTGVVEAAQMWPVRNDTVETASEGVLSVAELIAQGQTDSQ